MIENLTPNASVSLEKLDILIRSSTALAVKRG